MIILHEMKSVDDDILIDDGVCTFHPRNRRKGVSIISMEMRWTWKDIQ